MPWVRRLLPNGTYETVWVNPTPAPTHSSSGAQKAAARKKAAAAKAAAQRRAAAAARRKAASQRAAARKKSAAQRLAKRKAAAAAKRAAAQRAAARKSAAEKRRAAELRASQAAAAQARKEARAEAYERLQKRASQLVRESGLIRPTKAKVAVSGGKKRIIKQPLSAGYLRQVRLNAQRAAAAQATKDRLAREQVSNQLYNSQKQKALGELNRRNGKKTNINFNYTYGDDERIRDLEAVLKKEAERVKTGQVNYRDVEKATTAYMRLIQRQDEQIRRAVVKVQKAVSRLGKKTTTKAQIDAAKKVYDEYLVLYDKYSRINGPGDKPDDEGSYTEFMKNYQTVNLSQRDWWKKQMRANFEQTIKNNERSGPDERDSVTTGLARESLALMDGKIEPGWVRERDGMRQRTIEEEMEYRQARVVMERQKIAARIDAQRVRHQMILDGKGRFYDGADRRLNLDYDSVDSRVQRVNRQYYNGEMPALVRPTDLVSYGNLIIADWEKSHPPPGDTDNRGPKSEAMKAWEFARDSFATVAFAKFGSEVPGVLERAMQIPGVSAGMSILASANSIIGLGIRTLNQATTGNTVIRSVPDWGELPTDVKKRLGLDGPLAGIADAGSSLSTIMFGGAKGVLDNAKMATLRDWLKTPEGQKWWAARQAKLDEREKTELSDFLKAFEEGDAGGKLDALNTYGSRPSQSENDNLMFQLLADPTNAIPLNFTKYMARAKYASEMYKASNKSKKAKIDWARDFRSVSEARLDQDKAGKAYLKELDAKGMTPEQAKQSLREELAGVAAKDERAEFDRWMKQNGLTVSGLNPALVLNLGKGRVEKKILDEFGEDGLQTQARDLVEKKAKFDEDLRRAELVRQRERVSETSRVHVGDEGTLAKGAEAEGRLKTVRDERVAEVAKKVATEKAKPPKKAAVAAAEEPLGKAPPTAKPSVGKRLSSLLPGRTQPYFKKDVAKASDSNKFIGAGAPGSSTAEYAKVLGGSDTVFRRNDVVFVSSNGLRAGRVSVLDSSGKLTKEYKALDDAIEAGAVIRTDTAADRARPYNVGEREVATYLTQKGYQEASPGVWKKSSEPAKPPARNEPARFGTTTRTDRQGNVIENAALPSVFKHEEGYVYRVDSDAQFEAISELGYPTRSFASKLPDPTYAGPESRILRFRDDTAAPAGGGFNADQNVRLGRDISSREIEYLAADGTWKRLPDNSAETAQREFDAFARGDRDSPPEAVADVHDRLVDAISKFKTTKDRRSYAVVENEVSALIDRVVKTGGETMSHADWEELTVIAGDLAEFPALLRRLQNDIGERLLNQRVAASMEALAWRESILMVRAAALRGVPNAGDELLEVGRELTELHKVMADASPPKRDEGDFDSNEMAEFLGLGTREERAAQSVEQARIEKAYENKATSPVYSSETWDERAYSSSFYKGNSFVHYTNPRNVAGIERSGFDLNRGNSPFFFGDGDAARAIPALGRGVYLSPTAYWSKTSKKSLTGLVVKLDDDIRILVISSYDDVERLAKEFGVKVPLYTEEYAVLIEKIRASGSYDGVSIYDLGNWESKYKGQGRPDKSVRGLAGDQIVIFDPKKVTVTSRVEPSLASNAPPPVVPRPPRPQTATEAMPMTATEILLNDLTRMTHEQWMEQARVKALAQIKNRRTTSATKARARQILNDIEAVKLSKRIEAERKTPRMTGSRRRAWIRKVDRSVGKSAEGLISPKMIGPYARNVAGAAVEQARTYYRLLQSASPGPVVSAVRGLGPRFSGLDHFPRLMFGSVEQEIAAAIRKHRGWSANTRTKGRSAGRLEESEKAIGKMSDEDPAIVAIKKKILDRRGISVDAYDEARAVLWKGYVQDRTVKWLQRRTDDIVKRTGADWDETYLKLRKKEAALEAHRQLARLSSGEMFGFDPEIILQHFIARYTDDGTIREFHPQLSDFQRRTLEEHVKNLSGVSDISKPENLQKYFMSENAPPFEKGREAVRDWLVKHGAWSPRTAEQFVLGKKTWSIDEEAEYWRNSFGYVPPWTDRKVLSKPMGPFGLSIFSDPEFRYFMYKEWGMFGKSVELKHRLDGVEGQKLADAHIRVDPDLPDVAVTKELGLQRKYAVERYGDLVGVRAPDGSYVLHEMPDLMTPRELYAWRAKHSADNLPPGIIKDATEQEYIEALIGRVIDENWATFEAKVARGGQLTHEDVAQLALEIQKVVMADPKFSHRGMGKLGRGLDLWSAFSRWQIFSNPAFLFMNVADVPIKTLYYRMTQGGYFNPPRVGGLDPRGIERGRNLTLEHLGEDLRPTLYDYRKTKAIDYMTSKNPKWKWAGKAGRIISAVEGSVRLIPETAGRAEAAGKLWLARGMYPEVYTNALKRFNGDDELADLWARKYVKQQIKKMWPQVGDGPIEQFWNRIAPFSTYQVRNKVLFIREGLAHPELLIKMERIGAAIERMNRERWEEENPGVEFPNNKFARQIELPWAPGYFFDFASVSDGARGLKPLYGYEGSTLDYIASWVRVINPGTQAGIYALTNAFGLTPTVRWRAILDENGFPTGQYEKVIIGLTEPWSKDQPGIDSVFWLADVISSAQKFGADGALSEGDWSVLVGQAMAFGAIEAFDRGSAYYGFYKQWRARDKEGAAAWLTGTQQGRYLQQWLDARSKDLRPHFNPYKNGAEPDVWFFKQDKATQEKVKLANARIKAIRNVFAAKLALLTPRTVEFNEVKAEMWARINGVYLDTPELMERDVWSKTPNEWARDMSEQQTDLLTDTFFNMSDQRPNRADFKSQAEFNDAVRVWETYKAMFLATYPQVAKRVADARWEVQSVRDKVEAEWDRLLGNISERKEAIEALDAIISKKGYDSTENEQVRRDMLYLANSLDFALLEKDNAAFFYSYEDFKQLGYGQVGPLELVQKGLIKQAVRILDFDSVRFNKAKREGTTVQFFKDQRYAEEMQRAVSNAKGGDVFGKFDPKKWYDYMRKNPAFREQWFDKTPGKREEWAEGEDYIRHIAVWGKLVGREAWDAAGRAWDNLPLWVRQRYLGTNPDAKINLSGDYIGGKSGYLYEGKYFKSLESMGRYKAGEKYMDAISPWGRAASAGDWAKADRIWDSLPEWVKKKYRAANPRKAGSSYEYDGKYFKSLESMGRYKAGEAYYNAISPWGKAWAAGDAAKANAIWAKLPQWVKDKYAQNNPRRGGGAVEYNGQFFKSIASRDRFIAGKKYYDAISPWGKAASQGDWDRADAIWAALPQWVKDRYNAKNPNRKARSVQTTQYLAYMKNWVKLFDSAEKGAAMAYFDKLPTWVKERYFKKNPQNRIKFETSAKMSAKLAEYFAADKENQGIFLKANPDLQRWLAQNVSNEEQKRMAILQAYRSIPAGEAWLRRVMREKYPEIFSQEAAGDRRLKSVYDRLARHPEMLPLFEEWVDAIWDSYADMLKNGAPRPKNADTELKRRVPARKFKKSLSAEQASV